MYCMQNILMLFRKERLKVEIESVLIQRCCAYKNRYISMEGVRYYLYNDDLAHSVLITCRALVRKTSIIANMNVVSVLRIVETPML